MLHGLTETEMLSSKETEMWTVQKEKEKKRTLNYNCLLEV